MAVAIRSFALGLISIFVPIYLLKLDYNLSVVFSFIAVEAFAQCLVAIPGGMILSKFGFKFGMILGLPFLIMYFWLLQTLPEENWPLYLIAIMSGIGSSLYFVGYHFYFAKFSSRKSRGKELGLLESIGLLMGAVAPLIGGMLLVKLGFQITFLIVVMILCISLLPLYLASENGDRYNFEFNKIFSGQHWRDVVGHIGWGLERGVADQAWPISIFLLLGGVTIVGLITTISLLACFFTTYYVAVLTRMKMDRLLFFGSIVSAVVWFFKLLSRNDFAIIIVNAISGVARVFVNIPYGVQVYNRANETYSPHYLVARDVINTFVIGLFFSFLTWVPSLQFSLLMGAVGSLLYIFFRRR